MKRRALEPELMDDPALPPAELAAALRGLSRLNRFSGAAGLLWRIVRPLAATRSRPLRVLDIATGSGDVPVRLGQLAREARVDVELHACDLRPEMLTTARARAARAGITLTTFEFDATRDELPAGYDVAIASLICHHLKNEDIVELLRKMSRAARVVIVSDLERSALNLGLVWLGSRLLTRSQIVHVDGVLSIRAAFTQAELWKLGAAAGLQAISVRSAPPARLLLVARGEGAA